MHSFKSCRPNQQKARQEIERAFCIVDQEVSPSWRIPQMVWSRSNIWRSPHSLQATCCRRSYDRISYAMEIVVSRYELDEDNPGWVKGWAVVRNTPWDLAGLYPTEAHAREALLDRGPE